MSAVTFSVDFTGSPDADDILAAKHLIALENTRRAALMPTPGTPLSATTPGEIKSSYLIILVEAITTAHLSYITQAKSFVALTRRFTQAEIEQMFANVIARLNAGEPAATIVADTAS